MLRKVFIVTVVPLLLVLSGCNESNEKLSQFDASTRQREMARESMAQASMMRAVAPMRVAAEVSSADSANTAPSMQRKIAESQQWVFELPSSALEAVWAKHRDVCLALKQACDVEQASLSNQGGIRGARAASLEMRVDHAIFSQFLASIEEVGATPINTDITREDKTLQWVDLQSRLENAKNLRSRLQAMVLQADREHKLSDLLAIERELNRVQSTIDSMDAQSRVLAQQTDKVRMSFRYHSEPETIARDIWTPIRNAWHQLSNTFSNSLADVMLFVAEVTPWLLVIVPFLLFGRCLVRRVFSRRSKNKTS